MKLLHSYVNGEYVAGKREFDDLNPADGTLVAKVTEADRDLVDRAVESARRAEKGEWATYGIKQRAATLYKVAETAWGITTP